MNKIKKTNFKIILSLLLVVLIAAGTFTGCSDTNDDNIPLDEQEQVLQYDEQKQEDADEQKQETDDLEDTEKPDPIDIGEGQTVFLFEVTDGGNEITVFNVFTDEETVGAALQAVGLIDGDESEYGLYVKEVNGVLADFDTDGSWWAFYIDDEMAMSGVDSTDIEEGLVYAFVYTKD